MTNDDLTPWDDTPLVQALTSAASADELSGENDALAAFQASAAAKRRRGAVRFLGTGATAIALFGVVGGGVAAAAYTRSLPAPVQSALHDALGSIGVPAPVHHKHKKHPGTLTARKAHVLPSSPPTVAPTPPTARGHSPAPNNAAGGVNPRGSATPQASTSPLPTASATPTPSPSPTGPAGDPSTWTITSAASSRVVPVHGGVQISGTLLDAAGQPVADHRVALRVRVPGQSRGQRAAVLRTDNNGDVDGSLSNLTSNKIVVLAAGHGVHSTPLRITVRPALSVSATKSAGGRSYVITVSADGGNPGDAVNLLRRTPNGWQPIGHAQLDGTSSASFSVPAPKQRHRYLVRLPATKLHGFAAHRIVVGAAR